MKNAIFSLLLLVFLACTYYDHGFLYDFEKPFSIAKLGRELEEISGLHFKDQNSLYAIQDEEGKIFEIDLRTGDSKVILDFKEKGDYEGLSKKGEFFYVLKSNGSIYRVGSNGKFKKYPFLKKGKGYDFEGLCLDKEGKNLLVACKQHANKDKNDHIWIYEFSLKRMEYKKNEYLKIPKKEVHKKFKPSGIAVDSNGTLYITAANSFTLASFDKEGKLLNKAQLPFLNYPQVEGICFSPDGLLYLSSEKGDQLQGKVLTIKKDEK